MAAERRRFSRGVMLIEMIIAAVVIGVAVTGVLSYEYLAARQARMAKAHAAAVRIAYFLLQDWKANGGSIYYATGAGGAANPADLGMGFENVGSGAYNVTVDNFPMQVKLSRPEEYCTLIPITVTVRWRTNFIVAMTAYARVDQAGG